MHEMAGVQLHSVGVIVTAKYHNPSILNNDFLVNNKIVQNDWNVDHAISTPAVSVLNYSNGIDWLVDQQRLDISKKYNVPFESHDDGTIHCLATAYVNALPHVPYQDVGLNCVIAIKNKEPLQWMTQKFLKSESHSKHLVMVPRFTFKTEDVVLNFSFSEGTIKFDDGQSKSIIVHCNRHFAGPLKLNGVLQILSTWKDTKCLIASKLSEVLE